MKKYLAHGAALLIVASLAVPYLVSAEITPGEGWYLVPDCARSFNAKDACTFKDVLVLMNKFMQLLLYLIIPLATIGILVTGIKLTISGEAEKKAAKQSMTNILIGTFLTLAAYLIIDTVLKWLLKPGALDIPKS
jgi:hypothetical protein